MNKVEIQYDTLTYMYTLVVNNLVVLYTSSKLSCDYYAGTARMSNPPYVLPISDSLTHTNPKRA